MTFCFSRQNRLEKNIWQYVYGMISPTVYFDRIFDPIDFFFRIFNRILNYFSISFKTLNRTDRFSNHQPHLVLIDFSIDSIKLFPFFHSDFRLILEPENRNFRFYSLFLSGVSGSDICFSRDDIVYSRYVYSCPDL